jgi:hypothetical protein
MNIERYETRNTKNISRAKDIYSLQSEQNLTIYTILITIFLPISNRSKESVTMYFPV